MEPHPLDVNGVAPPISGLPCEGMFCEAFEYDGVVEATANVTYLCFGGQWTRLYFDCGIIFWRARDDAPSSWANPENEYSYPVVDIGQRVGILGVLLTSYEMEPTPKGSLVRFKFANGREVVVCDSDDRTDFELR